MSLFPDEDILTKEIESLARLHRKASVRRRQDSIREVAG